MLLGITVQNEYAICQYAIDIFNGANAHSSVAVTQQPNVMARPQEVACMVVDGYIFPNIDISLGNDFIRAVGGVFIDENAKDILPGNCGVLCGESDHKKGVIDSQGYNAVLSPKCTVGVHDVEKYGQNAMNIKKRF